MAKKNVTAANSNAMGRIDGASPKAVLTAHRAPTALEQSSATAENAFKGEPQVWQVPWSQLG